MAKKKEIADKVYLLEVQGGQKRVTVPSNWKLTFGPAVPYSGKPGVVGHNGESIVQGYSLRFYDGSKDNLRAIFTGVKSFRDIAIPIMEKRTQSQQKVVNTQSQGKSKAVVVDVQVTEWVNPDDDASGLGGAADLAATTNRMLAAGADMVESDEDLVF